MRRLGVLMAVCFVDMLGLMLVAPLMPFYALRLHSPEWMVGPLIASFAVAQLISSPVWGRVSDRYGRRPALLIGLGASAFAYVIDEDEAGKVFVLFPNPELSPENPLPPGSMRRIISGCSLRAFSTRMWNSSTPEPRKRRDCERAWPFPSWRRIRSWRS